MEETAIPGDESLHERIAKALGWTVKEAQSLSLRSLQSLLRTVDPALSEAIGRHCETDSHCTTRRATPSRRRL